MSRAHSLGLLHPDEQTYKWMLATLLISHYDDLPEPRVLFNKLNELKQACAAEGRVKAYQLDQLTTYPESPMELPKAVFDHAYPAGGPQPVEVQIHGLSSVAEKIPLRKNSGLHRLPPLHFRRLAEPATASQQQADPASSRLPSLQIFAERLPWLPTASQHPRQHRGDGRGGVS